MTALAVPAAVRRLVMPAWYGALVLACVYLALIPTIGTGYWVRTLTFIFMFAVLAAGWNLIGGFAGYAAFGQVGWFGMGAYSVAVAMSKWHWPFYPALALGTALPAAAALAVGLPVLRLRGHYFAIATLGIAITLRELVNNFDLTGAGSGLSTPLGPSFSYYYYLMFGAMLLAVAVTWMLRRSRLGYALLAIRENESAAATLGVNTTLAKAAAFAISAALAGLVGAIYAYWTAFIDPSTVFDLTFNVRMIVMVILGGTGTILGPVIGAFLLEGISQTLWSSFPAEHLIFFGIAVVLIVLFVPAGLSGLLLELRTLSPRLFVRNLLRYRV